MPDLSDERVREPRSIPCVYCGEVVPYDGPERRAEAVAAMMAHEVACANHPLARRVLALEEERATLKHDLTVPTPPPARGEEEPRILDPAIPDDADRIQQNQLAGMFNDAMDKVAELRATLTATEARLAEAEAKWLADFRIQQDAIVRLTDERDAAVATAREANAP
jgi:hypothetical protein